VKEVMLMRGFEREKRNPITGEAVDETQEIPRALAEARAHRG